jgi:hypothetical protein
MARTTKPHSIFPDIPAPLQRLFDSFPLTTYPPNELPVRSPAPSRLPTLHVFISERDALKGSPSFNPSCLKWQVSRPPAQRTSQVFSVVPCKP